MRPTLTQISIICLVMGACAHPNLVETGLSHQEKAELAIIRDYYRAINTRDLTALTKVLAENVKVMVGAHSWGKATELKNRREQWAKDPNYSVDITSMTTHRDAIQARVMVTFMAHGRLERQEIENVFKVQNNQIIQAVLSP